MKVRRSRISYLEIVKRKKEEKVNEKTINDLIYSAVRI